MACGWCKTSRSEKKVLRENFVGFNHQAVLCKKKEATFVFCKHKQQRSTSLLLEKAKLKTDF